jgi:hypothetical protein
VYLVINHFVSNGLYACHILGEPKKVFYGKVLRCVAASLLMAAILKLFSVLVHPSGWIGLFICGLLCCILGIAVYFMTGFDSSERNRILGIIRRR